MQTKFTNYVYELSALTHIHAINESPLLSTASTVLRVKTCDLEQVYSSFIVIALDFLQC